MIGYVATLYIGILFAGLAVAFVFAALMSLRESSLGNQLGEMERHPDAATPRTESPAQAA